MTVPPVAIVTGGGAGIGWAISCRLKDAGFEVIAADLAAGETTDPTAGIEWLPLDIRSPAAVSDAFDSVARRRGRIDALVNNAGIQLPGPLEQLSWSDWSSVIDVNLHGTFLCLQAAGRHMLEAGRGAIVNIASVAARGQAFRAPYATSKAAIVALTATAGAEWADRGVRVNAVGPGYVDSGVYRHALDNGTLDAAAVLARIPQRRPADASEIASVVEFLLSDRASYITGQTLWVDGGFLVDYGVSPRNPQPGPGAG